MSQSLPCASRRSALQLECGFMATNATTASESSVPADTVVVLLVDDQAIVGHAVRQMLQPETDIQLHFCQDPTKAVAMAGEIRPTVILQDLVMPEIDGLTLLKFFRANPATRETPMIVLSSKEEPTIKAQAFALGANDYLVKLPDRIELVARVRHHSRGYIAQLQRNEAYRQLAESQRQLAGEIAEAAKYVQSLLPPPIKEGPVRIDWRFVPSTQLAGDAFGYRWLDKTHLAIYLLDVSGHGVGSSLLAVSVLNVLSHGSLTRTDFYDPADVMRGLSSVFEMNRQNGKYFTLWYGVFDLSTRRLTFSGGGHPPALLLTGPSVAEARLLELQPDGPIIGIGNELPFANMTAELDVFARLLIYSDGAVEIARPDGRMSTYEEFTGFVSECQACDDMMERIFDRSKKTGGQDILADDCSLMQIDFQPDR
jgi:phosphoserine phosphatase RsbU/P